MTEDEAIDICARLGEVYASCNERSMVFKPLSLLQVEPEVVVQAMKLSYRTGYPFSEQLEQAYHFCFPQVAFFVLDEHVVRAQAYFDRCCKELSDIEKISQADITLQKLRIAQSMANCDFAVARMHLNTGYSINGTDPRADHFFDSRFLAAGPPDGDSEWVRDLARKCWRHLHVRVDEWQEFVSHLPIVA